MNKVSLALVIHSHQPVGNFDHVFEGATRKAYAPFLRLLSQHPGIRVSLHYSGTLLEWLEARHPEFFDQLRRLIERHQVELVGGGYFEPILPAIPGRDKIAQVRKLREYLRRHFGVTPKGAWVAERVWEPSLAQPLAEAGVDYVVLDDTHFLAAGLDPSDLHGVYITEEAGLPLRLVPSLKALRYTIPFREPHETLRILSDGMGQSSALFAMGDDCEKFGVWPGTFDHCYKNGWLERFLEALEGAEEWLETTTVSDFVAAHEPLGRIYLPTASYAEMMEWALPFRAASEYRACVEEAERMQTSERFLRFLRGGSWRNFLTKYPEANQLHKLMLEVSRRLGEAKARAGTDAFRIWGEAQTHLLASQCNDAYWHGVFGGLYAPHLRSAVLGHLIRAEVLLDQLEGAKPKTQARVATKDFDADGHEEVLLDHPAFGIVVRPADGGTVSSLRFKLADVELINSLMRRPEPYHDLIRRRAAEPETSREGPASIHHLVASKEANLDALLSYDRYLRHAFRTYLFPASKRWEDFGCARLEENGELAGAPWSLVADAKAEMPWSLALRRDARLRLDGDEREFKVLKTLTTKVTGKVWRVECRTSLSMNGPARAPLALGLEMVFNLLAGDAPDRYFQANETRHRLNFRGEIISPNLVLVDEWQRVQISLGGDPPPVWWVVPIETISQSEAGFERVYQGSAILAVWKNEEQVLTNAACDLQVAVSPWTRSHGRR